MVYYPSGNVGDRKSIYKLLIPWLATPCLRRSIQAARNAATFSRNHSSERTCEDLVTAFKNRHIVGSPSFPDSTYWCYQHTRRVRDIFWRHKMQLLAPVQAALGNKVGWIYAQNETSNLLIFMMGFKNDCVALTAKVRHYCVRYAYSSDGEQAPLTSCG